jgi:hypothetical protein
MEHFGRWKGDIENNKRRSKPNTKNKEWNIGGSSLKKTDKVDLLGLNKI